MNYFVFYSNFSKFAILTSGFYFFYRAKFGHDRVRNAVHCTDMPEDGILEVKYFFEILQQHQ